jgi:hypothetical protein
LIGFEISFSAASASFAAALIPDGQRFVLLFRKVWRRLFAGHVPCRCHISLLLWRLDTTQNAHHHAPPAGVETAGAWGTFLRSA